MHTIHHSASGEDHNHNYSFAISLWDRLFGTYRATATGKAIGLP
jgi:sterol desaturase/sphingolipid hydroxylase (fatty acid hydroxylase superfamily)